MNRPTFHAAIGKTSFGGNISRAFSSKDANAHTKLKFRSDGQASEGEMLEKDLKNELAKQENAALGDALKAKTHGVRSEVSLEKPKLLKFHPEVDVESLKSKYDDADAVVEDADDFESSDDSDDDDASDGDDDDDEDDEEELQRELERIKAERAASLALKEREDQELEARLNRESAIKGNPLVDLSNSGSGSAKVKRRWNDDVVFRNQAKDEQETKKRFVNDTIRNDFHRSFLKKYVK